MRGSELAEPPVPERLLGSGSVPVHAVAGEADGLEVFEVLSVVWEPEGAQMLKDLQVPVHLVVALGS